MNLADKIRELRIEKNLTQADLAKVLNVSRTTIANYENGNRSPSMDLLLQLADFFQVTTDFLLGRTNIKQLSYFLDCPQHVLLVDPDTGKILDFSKKAASFYGYERNELLNMYIWDIDISRSKRELFSILGKARRGEQKSFYRLHKTADGTIKEVEIFNTSIYEHNKLILFLTIYDQTDYNSIEDKIKKIYNPLLFTLCNLINRRIPYKENHIDKVTKLTSLLAEKLKLTNQTREDIRIASMLHEIGLINTPLEILTKPTEKLNKLEYELIKKHVKDGVSLLKDTGLNKRVLDIIAQHHEYLDGSGYPEALKGSEILLEAQILTITNDMIAMSSNRPYRSAYSLEYILGYLKEMRGIKYNAKAVDCILSIADSEEFLSIIRL